MREEIFGKESGRRDFIDKLFGARPVAFEYKALMQLGDKIMFKRDIGSLEDVLKRSEESTLAEMFEDVAKDNGLPVLTIAQDRSNQGLRTHLLEGILHTCNVMCVRYSMECDVPY